MNHLTSLALLLIAAVRVATGEAMNGLVWDALVKEHHARKGETNALVTFYYTNRSLEAVRIRDAKTSCHCTVFKDFVLPKDVAPGERGELKVEVAILVKTGALNKTITLATSAGTNVLGLKVILPELDQREKNRLAAFVDRQAVFKGDCAQCHSPPVQDKMGEPLYKAVCATCHDTPHRAEMVPDLAALKAPADKNYWEQWITVGKPGSFMPGFHKRYGGPLSTEQIASLAAFLGERFPARTKVAGKPVLPLD
jgi:mono/diheme cytochrome c family protein